MPYSASSPRFRPLFVSPSWPVESACNGVVPYIHTLATELKRVGHCPIVATSDCRSGSRDTSIEVMTLKDPLWDRLIDRVRYRVGRGPEVDEVIVRRLTGIIRSAFADASPDLVEVEEAFGTAASLVEQTSVPVAVRLHGPWFVNGPLNGARKNQAFERRVQQEGRALEAAALVTAPSQYILDATREFYGLRLPSAVVVPNAVAEVPFEERWSAQKADKALILFVGRFDAIKGGDVILRAFEQVARRFPNSTLAFIGPDDGVSLVDGQMTKIDQFLANQMSTDAALRVLYLGRQGRQAINRWRKRATLCVIPSRFDNFPTTALEAAAFGMPVIATTSGGIPEIIKHERTGLLVSPGDAESLSAAILRLLQDRSFAAQLGAAAAADVETRFTPSTVAQQMLRAYEPYLNGRQPCL